MRRRLHNLDNIRYYVGRLRIEYELDVYGEYERLSKLYNIDKRDVVSAVNTSKYDKYYLRR